MLGQLQAIETIEITRNDLTFAYSILWDMQFLLCNLALIGALLLVLADARGGAQSFRQSAFHRQEQTEDISAACRSSKN
ncbi:unnamed protein product [Parnassius apollo]|uniref:(apollo) hypothetical protein n=1 Tax=Parnassius apollo TaxID=110799 RepID=A0A8S3YEY6_PARAO|nr:unnamed protein product [Parnassius apollo]